MELKTSFLLGSNPLANHGDYICCLLLLITSFFFTSEYFPIFKFKNMILTYTNNFPCKKWPKFANFFNFQILKWLGFYDNL
jgi:hypothetical protein